MLAAAVFDIAVVRALARDLAQVPAHARIELARGQRSPTSSSLRANNPDGASSCDSSAGASVLGSGSLERMALMQMRVASAITTTIRIAKNAARIPSTVEFVTTAFMSSMLLAGGRTSSRASASLKRSRWAKKPSFGSLENTFW